MADAFDLLGIVANEILQPIGIRGDAFDGDASESFQVTRLRFDEVASERKFAVHHLQSTFQLGRLVRQSASGIGEAIGFPAAVAHGDHINTDQQNQRNRPLDDPVDPLIGCGPGQHLPMMNPGKKPCPAKGCQCCQSWGNPCATRFCWLFFEEMIFIDLFLGRFVYLVSVAIDIGFGDGFSGHIVLRRDQVFPAAHDSFLTHRKGVETMPNG